MARIVAANPDDRDDPTKDVGPSVGPGAFTAHTGVRLRPLAVVLPNVGPRALKWAGSSFRVGSGRRALMIWARIVSFRDLGAKPSQIWDGFAPRSAFAPNRAQMAGGARAEPDAGRATLSWEPPGPRVALPSCFERQS